MATMESVGDVAELLLGLASSGHAGILEIVGDEGVRTDLFLKNGEVIFAEQGTLGETLGRLLLREGVLSQDQYAKVIERMTERLIDTEQLRFGEAAVQLGFVDAQQIHEGLTMQVALKASRSLQSLRVDVTLRDDPEALAGVTPFPARIKDCVLIGIREYYDHRRLDHILFEVADQCPVVTAATREFVAGLPLDPVENRLVAKLPRDVTVLGLLRNSNDSLMVKRLLAFLKLAHVIEFVSPTGVRSSQVVVAKEPAPDPSEKPLAKPKDRASAIAVQIARAVGRSIPPPVSHKRARLEAEQAFSKGQRLAGQAKWDQAFEAFNRASRCMPDALEYGLHAVWAEVMSATTTDDRTDRLKAAGVIARQAMKQEPNLAYAYYVEGNVALELGREEIALKRFRKAASLDPGFTDAVRHARLLQRRLEK